MLPFTGRVHVVYIPNRKVIRLSKIPRIVLEWRQEGQRQNDHLGHARCVPLRPTRAEFMGQIDHE